MPNPEGAVHHLTHGLEKPVRPGAKMTCGEAADSLVIPGATQADLERAYALNPAHPLIHAALAAFQKNPARAAFLRDYGLKRLPAELKARADELRKSAD